MGEDDLLHSVREHRLSVRNQLFNKLESVDLGLSAVGGFRVPAEATESLTTPRSLKSKGPERWRVRGPKIR